MPPAAGSRTAGPSTSSDRRPTRQGRTTVRPTNYYARTFAGRSSGMEQTPEAASSAGGFCPALTHFSQAVDAFPKELIRHFSMFKEVEAKIHDPERSLRLMFDEIDQMPVPTQAERRTSSHNSAAVENNSGVGANGGGTMQDPAVLWQQLAAIDPETLSLREQADLKKRRAFCRLRMHIVNILPALDEKLVVLGGAKTTKDKGLARMNNSYAHLDDEVSEEARYGSLSHWAYADKEEKKKGSAHERQRREVASANNLAAAAQHMHDVESMAAKSEARREAMLANKRSRHQHVDSDFDDRPAKKPQKRKAMAAAAAEAAGNDGRAVGLGITSNGAASQGKRKKTEKALAAAAAAAAAPPMERSLSGALKAAAGPGGRSGTSPRATPSVEGGGTGKRKPRAPPAPAQRKHALPAYSPQPASSPLVATFTLPKGNAANGDRPTAARARNNSIANSVASAAPEPPAVRRPSTSHSVQQPATTNAVAELEVPAGTNRDNASTKGASTPQDTTEMPPFETIPAATALKHEDVEMQEPESMEIDAPASTPSNARAGRASKTATPVVGAFPEIPMVRSRSTRKANNGNGNSNTSSENNSTITGTVSKRNKKTTAASSATMQSPVPDSAPDPKSNPQSSRASSIVPEEQSQEAESDEDGDEPRYCYCNQVSFGNMIACDNDSCPREWFHLPCVNLDRAPSGRTKWFCSDECKEAHAKAKTGKGGRPGSSRQ